MRTPRPRPVPPGSVSPKGSQTKDQRPNGSLRTGAIEAMRDQALRRAAEHTDFTYKRGDASVGGGSPFAGFGWEEVRNDDTQGTTEGEFVPR